VVGVDVCVVVVVDVGASFDSSPPHADSDPVITIAAAQAATYDGEFRLIIRSP
jgi:hypothetical protein